MLPTQWAFPFYVSNTEKESSIWPPCFLSVPHVVTLPVVSDPRRYPFLLVDKILEHVPGESAVSPQSPPLTPVDLGDLGVPIFDLGCQFGELGLFFAQRFTHLNRKSCK